MNTMNACPPELVTVFNSDPSILAAYQADPAHFLQRFQQEQFKALSTPSVAQGTPAQSAVSTTQTTRVTPPSSPLPDSASSDREEKGLRFTLEEDERICRCWLRVTEDPIEGTQQKLDAFWKRVTDTFNSDPVGPVRPQKAVSNCWHKIARSVNVFVGCYRRALGLQPSGEDNAWALKQAHTFFKEKERVSFKFLHCWQILKVSPKYMISGEKVGDAFVLGVLGDRPEGVKSAKKRKHDGGGEGGFIDEEAKLLLERGLKLKEKEEARLERAGKIAEVKDLMLLYGKDDPIVVKLLAKLREDLLDQLD